MSLLASRRADQGVALVTTIIVVAVMAVVAVAFLQSTSTDRLSSRTVANHYRAKLAAEAGLAAALVRMEDALGDDLAYLSGAEADEAGFRTFIRPLDGSSGAWRFDGDPVYLDSGSSGDTAQFVLTGSPDDPVMLRSATWQEMPALEGDRENETVRYAFWTDEAGGKQNLTWWGGAGTRGSLANLSELQMVLPDPDGTSVQEFPESAMAAISAERSVVATNFEIEEIPISSVDGRFSLPSVATANLLDPALQDDVSPYFFTLNSYSGAATPGGRIKLNFARLANYVNGLSTEQGSAFPRARLVEQLLQENPEDAENWGGGSLHWLAQSGKYSATEQKQIVANIVDYLDEDLIPTTDSIDIPTYFGSESKLQNSGLVRGHPYITTFGAGCVFNRTASPSAFGQVNSTRVLFFVTLANPWTDNVQIDDWVSPYTPEIEVQVSGRVLNGTLGSDASAYFVSIVNNTPPVSTQILANGDAGVFPGPVQGNAHFNNFRQFFPGPRQPTNLTFVDLEYTIKTLRMLFTDDSGRKGYAQIIPTGKKIKAQPTTIVAGGGSSPLRFIFTEPASAEQEQWFLQGDPRANFRSDSWVSRRSSTAVPVPLPVGAIDPFAGVDREQFDGEQGIKSGYDWYASGTTNHFARASREGMESIGELGYIWTGKPWQTLNLIRTADPETADWNLLDHVTAGRSGPGGTTIGVLPLKMLGDEGNATAQNALVAEGGFNVNTRKVATLTAFMTNAPGLGDEAVQLVQEAPVASEASAFAQIASWASTLTNFVAGAPTEKFALERAQRSLANGAVNHSRLFTVYAAGEYRMGTTYSRAFLEAEVFVGVDTDGSPKIQVINQTYR